MRPNNSRPYQEFINVRKGLGGFLDHVGQKDPFFYKTVMPTQ